MSKKPAASLSAGLVAVKGMAAPAADMPGRLVLAPVAAAPVAPSQASPRAAPTKRVVDQAQAGQGEAGGQPLNFRVPESFRREFKIYAATHGLKLNELLRLSFDAYRRRAGS